MKKKKRNGVAATEFAIVMPLLFLVIAGTIEICTGFFLKESLTVAAFEGARVAVQRKSTLASVENRIMAVLAERGVNTSGMTEPIFEVTPNPETAAITTPIEVTVRAPMTGNTIIPLRGLFTWLGDGTVSADVTMIKEFVDVVN